jgi:hypothetical protein
VAVLHTNATLGRRLEHNDAFGQCTHSR